MTTTAIDNRTYQEKLLDPRWQRVRLSVFDRDGWKCVVCNSDSKTLHVHHKHYRRGVEPWEYELDELETRCFECHKKKHEKLTLEDERLLEIARKSIPSEVINRLGDPDFICSKMELRASRGPIDHWMDYIETYLLSDDLREAFADEDWRPTEPEFFDCVYKSVVYARYEIYEIWPTLMGEKTRRSELWVGSGI